MSKSMSFLQECPTCGRGLYVRVEHLGKQVVCQHCHGPLIACDRHHVAPAQIDAAHALLRRANRLLAEKTLTPTKHRESPLA